MQDKLATERKLERDRLAKDVLGRLAGKEGESTAAASEQERSNKLYKTFGVESLLSDNMNLIMHYDFNKQFLSSKKVKEGNLRS